MSSVSDLAKINISKLSISMLFDSKARSSLCWKHFGGLVLHDENKKKRVLDDQVFCNVCLTSAKRENKNITFGLIKVKSYNKTVSTGNLIRHLRDDHQITDVNVADRAKKNIQDFFKVSSTAKANLASSSNAPNANNDKWLLARDLAMWFCKSLMPFDSVSDEGMTDFFKKYDIIVTNEELPSRHTVSRTALDDIYESMLENVKGQILIDGPPHLAVSFDLWTDRYRRLNYITFTLHYLTADFQLKYFTLNTQVMEEKKTGEKIQALINETIKSFGLNDKKVHTVTDSGSNVKRAVSLAQLENHLCLGHGLHNLVTVDGINKIPEVENVVKKCKKIVKALRNRLPDLEAEAEKEQQEFLNSVESVARNLEIDENDPIPDHGTKSDQSTSDVSDSEHDNRFSNLKYVPTIKTATPTRWHSILEMLESLIHSSNRKPVNNLLRKIGQDDLKIVHTEWNLLEDLVRFLNNFREAVEVISSQKTSTLNVALVFRSEIKDVLNSITDDETLIMFSLRKSMLENIDKRFPISKAVVAAALLDCRFMGLKELDSYLEREYMTRASFLAAYTKQVVKLSDLSAVDANEQHDPSQMSNQSKDEYPKASLLFKLSQKHSYGAHGLQDEDPIDQECWKHLTTSDLAEIQNGDLLAYWNHRKNTFPWLSALARAVLCIPATSTPSDRVFSEAGLVLSAKRSRLSPVRVNKIIFVHGNL